jgi:hypothetical protein
LDAERVNDNELRFSVWILMDAFELCALCVFNM